MVNVVIVNGFPRSGKDTFVNFCKEKLGAFGVSVSTVDFVKYLAAQSGWDGSKTPENRKFLSDLKDLLTEWNDVPWKKVEEVFETIIPEYLGGVLYGALCESRAAEQAARQSAMDSATQNADDMIADLSLKFNQARQAAITQEITEIVAGS